MLHRHIMCEREIARLFQGLNNSLSPNRSALISTSKQAFKITSRELRIPGARLGTWVERRNKKNTSQRIGKTVLHYLLHPSPKAWQHSLKRDTSLWQKKSELSTRSHYRPHYQAPGWHLWPHTTGWPLVPGWHLWP